MKTTVNFICPEIVGSMGNGCYDVPNGATIRDVFRVCQSENNITVNEDYLRWLLLLANGKPAVWDTVLEPDSEVYILRRALGG